MSIVYPEHFQRFLDSLPDERRELALRVLALRLDFEERLRGMFMARQVIEAEVHADWIVEHVRELAAELPAMNRIYDEFYR